MKKKTIALFLALALVVGCAIGGTVAWLTASTTPVVNTFTVGDINITLTETTTDYKMVPGNTIAKDPKATVLAGSEDCYLFVKIEKSTNYSDYLEEYVVAEGWQQLKNGETPVEGVYYREVAANTANQDFYVLASKTGYTNGYVVVKDTVTKTDMNSLTATTYPTLTFTAYASQLYKDGTNKFTPAEAWAVLNPPTT